MKPDETLFSPLERLLEADGRATELVRRENADAYVSILATDESVGWDVLDGTSYAAKIGVEHGLQRRAIVGDGVEQLAATNRFEVPEVELLATDDPDEAIEWARDPASSD